ncbi:MAG: O-antigen translocase [Candidatus Contendobacter sp.]|nr:O-antigen translocase [Candidatus Contendobacter sp.]
MSSYTQILKSSSLIGGAQGINLLLGMVRVKFAAVLIGPVGVGLAGNYQAIQGVVGTIAGLGIQASGVREVAEAVGTGDQQAMGRAILTLRRMCWLTGLLGMLAMVALSPLLSQWTFGSNDHAVEIALLGIIILLGNLSGGQMALIQGMRRIGDLARLQVISAVAGTVIAIGCYTGFGLRGIVPALLLMAVVQLAASWYFARRVPAPTVAMSWWESFRTAGGLVRLGLVFMWNGLIGSLVAYLTVTLITQQISLEAVGIYSAAFALSGMFVGFVLNAMGADYYPRLTAVASDQAAVNRLVNEQTEIGLLLAVPGLLATLALAPWIIRIFYTGAFLPAADLLQWFILGCLGRVVSWPLGFVMLALGKGQWFFVTETLFNAVHLALIAVGLVAVGIEGVALAFFILYLGYTAAVYGVGRHLTGFRWSLASQKLLLVLLPIIAVAFIAARLLPLWPATGFGIVATGVASVLCLRGLVQRIGPDHRIVHAACRVPGMQWACGL